MEEKCSLINQIEIVLRGRKLKQAVNQIYAPLMDKYQLKQIDIEVLSLFNYEEVITFKQISNLYGFNKGQLSISLGRLCKKGYVEAYKEADDKRTLYIKQRSSGKEIVEEIKEKRKAIEKILLSNVDKEEYEAFQHVTSKFYDNIEYLLSDIKKGDI